MYQKQIKVFRGTDNTVEFDFKNAQQRPADVSDFVIECVITDYNNLEVFKGEVVKVSASKAVLTIPADTFAAIVPQFLKYALYIVDTGNKLPLYADTQFGVTGNITLVEGPVPVVQKPKEVNVFTYTLSNQGTTVIKTYQSDAIEVKPLNDLNDTTMIGIDFVFDQLDGEVKVQFTNDDVVSNSTQWKDAEVFVVTSSTTFLRKTYNEIIDYTDKVTWTRIVYTPSAGNTGKIAKVEVKFGNQVSTRYPLTNKYTWKRDLPDPRDHIYQVVRPTAVLPPNVDLRQYCSPIEDQGSLGSCTGNAVAGLIELIDRKNGKILDVSRLFIYYQTRLLEGTVKYDTGAYIRDAIKACYTYGAPLETLWPYTINRWATKPTTAAYLDATRRKVTGYQRCLTFAAVKSALAAGNPVVVGFDVYSSFESALVSTTGMMPYPNIRTEQYLGGHAVALVGYDDSTQRFIARNSWGSSWGDKGYFYMPYAVIQDTSMSADFWLVSAVKNP